MKSSFRFGQIFGITLKLHFSWFVIFILITTSLVLLPLPGTSIVWQRIIIGITGSLLFFSSILVHELAHSYFAIRNKIPVKDITLFIFGGVSHISKEASRPKTEIQIAVVGPLSSLLIAALFYGVYIALQQIEVDELITNVMLWLALINTIMALFNLIPGFPLDGGRVFRSIIWLKTNDFLKATRIATLVGRIIGYLFVAGGLFFIIQTGEWVSGVWLAFIGWFLESSASTGYRDAVLRDTLHNYSARDIIGSDCRVISPDLSIEQLVKYYVLPTGYRCFIVSSDGKTEGFINIRSIKRVPQQQWNITPVTEIMSRIDNLARSNADQNALELLEYMQENKLDQVVVVDKGNIIGLITFNNLLSIARALSDLKIKNLNNSRNLK